MASGRLHPSPTRMCVLVTALLCGSVASAGIAAESFDAVSERLRNGVLSASTGTFFSSGDYGRDDETDVWYVPFEVRYDVFPFRASVTVPYLRIRGPAGVVGIPGDGVIGDGDDGEVHRRDGVGDVLASLSYTFVRADSRLPVLRFAARAKFGTADAGQGLGTGENDYSLITDASQRFGPVTPFASLGYRFVGDPPGVDLRNTWLARAGLSYRLRDGLDAGVMYGWRQSSWRASGDSHNLTPFGSWKLGGGVSLMPYAVFGLSTYSPDFGGGLQIRLTRRLHAPVR